MQFLCFPSVLLYAVRATGSAEVERLYNCTGPFCEVQFSSITHTEKQFTRFSVVALTNKNRTIETTVSIGKTLVLFTCACTVYIYNASTV